MRQISLKFIGRDLLIGLITASFVYAPNAFAKPNNKAKKPAITYAQMLKMVKTPGTKKMSDLADAAKPMLKKREYKLFLKDAMRSWDTKFNKMVVGRNYFKFQSGGKTYFGRYVDRGSVAFILNNKPILWKDVLFYSQFRGRIHEILTGKKIRKVSALEHLINYLSGEAHAEGSPTGLTDGGLTQDRGTAPQRTVTTPAATPSSGGKTVCITLDSMNNFNSSGTAPKGIRCPSKLRKSCDPVGNFNVGLNVICDKNQKNSDCARAETIPGELRPNCDPKKEDCETRATTKLIACDNIQPKPKGKVNWAIIAIIGLLFLFLLLKKKKKKRPTVTPPTPPDPPNPPDPPTPPYTPGGESTCPPKGSRGITEEERLKLPGCNKSNCVKDGTCVNGGSGETID